jgi:hypothetical protein
VMSGILMTHAVVFVGYSLNDVNFRLLLDQQLTTFRGRVPPRFAVLGGVGPAERETLWRTARLRVLPYPAGRHEEVGKFLGALVKHVGKRARSSPPPAASAKPPAVQASSARSVLTIASDGDRLSFELVSQKPTGLAQLRWCGSARWHDFDGLRARLVELMPEPNTHAEWRERLARAGTCVTRLLPTGLRRALAALPKSQLLELDLDSATEPIPWEWAVVNGAPLAVRSPLVRRPVDVSPGSRGYRRLGRPLRALVIGDAGYGLGVRYRPLPMAEQEADRVAQVLHRAPLSAVVRRLSLQKATAESLLHELDSGDHDLVHFAGHAWAGPSDAYLYLWDRQVLGTELAPLLSRRPPALMVLSTHHTAFFPLDLDRNRNITAHELAAPKLHGEPAEDRGFTSLAMRCGVASLVGCGGSVSDEGSAVVMRTFYEQLARGATVAVALSQARRRSLRGKDPSGMHFFAIGDADFRLRARPSRAK